METAMLSGPYDAAANLASWWNLVQHTLLADYWGGERFHLALWQAGLGLLAVVILAASAPNVRRSVWLLVGLVLITLLLQTTFSRPFWQAAPFVRFIQFPWRLLGLSSFGIAIVVGSLFLWRPLRRRAGAAVAIAALSLIVIAGMAKLDPALSPLWYAFSSDQISKLDMFERGRYGFALFADYTPLAMKVKSEELAASRPTDAPIADPLSVTPAITVLEESPHRVTLHVRTAAPIPLRFHRIYFPGWQIRVDGEAVETQASAAMGLVTATLPAGDHRVQIAFEDTPVRRLAGLISVLTVAILAVIGLRSPGRTRFLSLSLAAMALVVFLIATATLRLADAPRRPISYAANFQDEIHLVGYHLSQSSWNPGDTLTVRLYWFVQQTPPKDYKVFIHLLPGDDDDAGKLTQLDTAPFLGFGAATRWQPGELIVDEYSLPLPEDTPTGVYRLVVGWYDPDTMRNLVVRDAPSVLPGDRLLLTPITVQAESP